MDKENKSSAGWKSSLRNYFHELFDIRGDMMSYQELDEMMVENTEIHGSNMWILMLAIFIASIGLNVNSTAVIIGAMLISPLMSGILTMGYSLATRDLPMLKKALTRFGTQVAISLIASTLYFCITPLDVATSEMIARTSPTLWDVSIALFGGLAGMIGNTRTKKGNVIPGVAIATALMPPLCTAGYGLATLQLRFLLGAFYLFAINTLFIMLSSAVVTRLLKVPAHQDLDERRQKRINRIITVITVLTVIPSVLIGGVTVYDTVMEKNISEYISKEFVFADTQVVQSSSDNINRTISVSLVGAPISNELIERLELEMERYSLGGYTLHVTQNQNIQTDNSDVVTMALQEKTIQELQAQLEEQRKNLDELKAQSAESADCGKLAKDAAAIFTKLSDCACGLMYDSDGEYILLKATAAGPISEDEYTIIQNWLLTESGMSRAEVQIKDEYES